MPNITFHNNTREVYMMADRRLRDGGPRWLGGFENEALTLAHSPLKHQTRERRYCERERE